MKMLLLTLGWINRRMILSQYRGAVNCYSGVYGAIFRVVLQHSQLGDAIYQPLASGTVSTLLQLYNGVASWLARITPQNDNKLSDTTYSVEI